MCDFLFFCNKKLSKNCKQMSSLAKDWLRLALQPSVVTRALKYAVVVGLVLITINHGDALLRGQITRARLLKMALTVLVPYVVSTLSSVGALRERRDRPAEGAPPP